MTKEEKLDWLYRLRSEIYVFMPKEWLIPMNNALDAAIKALEQEPKAWNLDDAREEAIKRLRGILAEATEFSNSVCYVTEEDREPLEMAIKALEQEPTTKNDLGVDCISRFEVTEIINAEWDKDNMLDKVDALPSVTPQEPKTGHWIPTYGNVKCSVCGSVKDSRDVGKATHYCDFCGAKMVEQQEGEDKE